MRWRAIHRWGCATADPANEGSPREPVAGEGVRDVDSAVYSAGQELAGDGRAFEHGRGRRSRRRSCAAVRSSASAGRPACCGASSSPSWVATTSPTSPSARTSTSTCARGSPVGASATCPRRSSGTSATPPGARFSRPAADNARLVARNRLSTQLKFVPASARRGSPRSRRVAAPRHPAAPPPRHPGRQARSPAAAASPAARAPPPARKRRTLPRPRLARASDGVSRVRARQRRPVPRRTRSGMGCRCRPEGRSRARLRRSLRRRCGPKPCVRLGAARPPLDRRLAPLRRRTGAERNRTPPVEGAPAARRAPARPWRRVGQPPARQG